jgi:prolyl 4-hydroxylase
MSSPPAVLAPVIALAQAGRLDDAVALLRRMGDEGEAEALVLLGDFHWQGGPVAQDPKQARDFYRRAADAGHPRAAVVYTNLLASGVSGEVDWPAALGRLRREAGGDAARARALRLIEAMNLRPNGEPQSVPTGKVVSDSPRVTRFAQLFTPEECDFLLEIADPGFHASMVVNSQGREVPDPMRSSDGAPLHWMIEDPAVNALNRRLAAVSGAPYDQAEAMLILRYRPGQEYRRHFDALPGLENQRILTALVYLNDDYVGGETAFPRADLKIRGARGDAIVFHNTGPDGRADPMSEHAGLPVTEGVKYLASRWIRERRHLP